MTTSVASVWAIHVVCTCMMTGIIWVVQRVHYPLFHQAASSDFVDYHRRHVRTITPLVAPTMFLELVTAGYLVWLGWDGAYGPVLVVGFALCVSLWGSTMLWQVPLHGRLSSGYDAILVSRLVRSNWFRTAGWTFRLGLVFCLMVTGAPATFLR